jgi:hypothetical protein
MRRLGWALLLPAVGALASASTAGATGRPHVPELDWKPREDRFECATAEVPLDHDLPASR